MTETMLVPVVPTSEQTIVRRVLLDSAYALTAFVIAVPSFALVVAGVAAGVGTIVVAGIGLGVLVGTAYVARGFAHVERLRLRSMLGVARRRDPVARLTPREREVMALMAQGRSNGSIAEALSVTLGAVEKHTQRIFAKLDLAPDDDAAHRRVLAVVRFLRVAG